MADAPPGPRVGDSIPDILDGRYRLERLIGSGGMGSVFRAVDTRLERAVAVKVLKEGAGASDERFGMEVRTLAGFIHPHLVRLLDAGEVAGRPYLVMDLVDGQTLSERLATGPLESQEVRRIGRDVASALAYVHAAGIVHRDVKPANVLLDPSGSALLADFGIARLIDTAGLTATGMTMGTPAYLAPEQIQGGPVSGATDVYALGLVLIESLTGRRAFEGTPSEVAAARLSREPALPVEFGRGWRELLSAMTAIDPDRRDDARAVAALLAEGGAVAAVVELPTVPLHLNSPGADTTLAAGIGGEDATLLATRPYAGARPADTDRSPRWRATAFRGRTRQVVIGASLVVAAVGLGLGVGYAVGGPTSASANQNHLVAKHSSSTTTSPTSTSTSTTTTSTTTTTAPPTVTSAANEVLSVLQAGAANGTIDPPAAQNLENQLQPLLLTPPGVASPQQIQQFDQVAQAFNQQVAAGAIRGATADSLATALNALAAVLDTAVPTSTTVPTPPGPPGGAGKGNGNGHGHHGQGD